MPPKSEYRKGQRGAISKAFSHFMAQHKPIDLASFVVLFYDRIGYSHYTGSFNSFCKHLNIDVKTAKSYISDLQEIEFLKTWDKKGQTVFHCKSVKYAFTDILSMDSDSKHIRVYRPFGDKKHLNRTNKYQYENISEAKKSLKEAILLHKLKQQNYHVQKAATVQQALSGQTISGSAQKALKKAYKGNQLESLKNHRKEVVTGSRHIANTILHTSKSDAHKTLKRLESKGHFVLKPVLKSNCRKLTQKQGEVFNEKWAKFEIETINKELRGNYKVFLNKNTMKLNYFIGTVVLFNFI